MALVAASELFLRMVRLARLSADSDLAGLPVGLGQPARAGLHVLDPGLCHRYPASGSPDAAFARRALPRLPVANEYLFPRAAAFERCGMTGGPGVVGGLTAGAVRPDGNDRRSAPRCSRCRA